MGDMFIRRSLPILLLVAVTMANGIAVGEELSDYLRSLGYARTELKRFRDAGTGGRNYVHAEVKLGRSKQRWVVDTGWSFTTIHSKAARSLKTLQESRLRIKDPILGELSGTNWYAIPQMTIGNLEFVNQPAQVSSLKMGPNGAAGDGMFGIDLMRRCHAFIEFGGGGLYVRESSLPPEASAALRESLRSSGWTEVFLKPTLSLCFVLDAPMGGRQVRMLVDSGAFFTTLDLALGRELGLKLERNPLVSSVGVNNRIADFYSTELDELKLGELKLTRVPVEACDLSPWREPGGTHFDGLLGADLLALCDALLDCSTGRLYLKPIPEKMKRK